MWKYLASLILLIWIPCTSLAQLNMSHKVTMSSEETNCLLIETVFHLDNTGKLLIYKPTTYNGPVHFNGDKSLRLEEPFEGTILVISKPSTHVKLEYQNCIKDYQGNLNQPLLSRDFVSFMPSAMLFLPWHLNHLDWNVKLYLSPFKNSFISYTELASKSEHDLLLKGADFMTAQIIAGEIKPIKMIEGDFQADFIVKGEPTVFPNEYLDHFFDILNIQNSFWKDCYDKKTTVVLNFENTLDSSFGFHSPNVFVMSFSKKHPYGIALAGFSHENFHQWMGNKLRFPGNNEYAWIMEGLTDYMGVTLSHQNDLISNQQYIELLNLYLQNFHVNPFYNKLYKDLIKHPTSTIETYSAIFYRTHLASLAIEHALNLPLAESPIGLAVKDLYLEAPKAEHGQVGEVVVQKVFQKHFTEESWKIYQEMIAGTRSIALPKTLFQGRARLVKKNIKVSDLGFDLEAFFVENAVKNLSENSSAYKAGLREHHQVLSHQVFLTSRNAVSNIVVKNGEGHKTISFTPNKTRTITVDQYELVERPGAQPLLKRH